MKTLLLDIETFPNVGYVWGKYQQDVIDFVDHWYILSFAYKWFNEREAVKVLALDDDPLYKPGIKDSGLILPLWELLDKADVVVAHNGQAFDASRINTRFLQYKMGPPSPYKIVDTLKTARKFSFNSNKLDDLGRDTAEGRKEHHFGFPTWLGCARGDKAAWKMLKKYNKKDVELLERVYRRLLPWIDDHPNIGAFNGDAHVCPNCGSKKVHCRGYAYNKTTQYQRYFCTNCSGWSRGTKNLLKDKPLVSLPAVSGR